VLGSRASIAESDQGKSFHAFYDFLLSYERQEQFAELLQRVQTLEGIGEVDPRMRRIHHDWLEAGERTQATVRQLSEQLRRFLDDQVWLENRRVSELLRGIESTALKLRQVRSIEFSTEMDASAPTLALPMERPLYTPTAKTPLDSAGIEEAGDDLDTSVIFDQIVVDPQRLSTNVRHALQRRDQVGLVDVVTEHPIEHGLAEVVTYFSLDDPGFEVVFDESVAQHLAWVDPDGTERIAAVPGVSYVRVSADRRSARERQR